MSEVDINSPEIKAAIRAVVDEETAGLKAKNAELLAKLRKSQEITPEAFAEANERADKAEAALNEATKALKVATVEREKAVKALEAESGAARSYALEAEINAAIAAGNVVPALVPGFRAMVASQAKADLVDGKYAVQIGDKPAAEYIKTFLDSDDGKAWRAAPLNGGGGAPGSNGQPPAGAKVIPRTQFDAMSHAERSAFSTSGGKVVDAA